MSTLELFVRDSAGTFSPAPDRHIIQAANAAVGRALRRNVKFDSPRAARKYLPAKMGHLDHEIFCLAHLDTAGRLIEFEELFRGTVDSATVHAREVVKSVLRHGSSRVILVHNHPSGHPDPSPADEFITRRLKDALSLIDAPILDHMIVAGESVTSFAERGLL